MAFPTCSGLGLFPGRKNTTEPASPSHLDHARGEWWDILPELFPWEQYLPRLRSAGRAAEPDCWAVSEAGAREGPRRACSRLRASKAINCIYRQDEPSGLISAWAYDRRFVLTWEECRDCDQYDERACTRDERHEFRSAGARRGIGGPSQGPAGGRHLRPEKVKGVSR